MSVFEVSSQLSFEFIDRGEFKKGNNERVSDPVGVKLELSLPRLESKSFLCGDLKMTNLGLTEGVLSKGRCIGKCLGAFGGLLSKTLSSCSGL